MFVCRQSKGFSLADFDSSKPRLQTVAKVLSASMGRLCRDANTYTQQAAAGTILQLLDAASRRAVITSLCDELDAVVRKESWKTSLELLAKLAEEAEGCEMDLLLGACLPLLNGPDPDVNFGC